MNAESDEDQTFSKDVFIVKINQLDGHTRLKLKTRWTILSWWAPSAHQASNNTVLSEIATQLGSDPLG